jgi:hypothetical protein
MAYAIDRLGRGRDEDTDTVGQPSGAQWTCAGASEPPGAGAIARRPARRILVLGRDGAERRLDGLGRRCGAFGRACRTRAPGTGRFAGGRCGFAGVTSFPEITRGRTTVGTGLEGEGHGRVGGAPGSGAEARHAIVLA